MQSTLDDVDLFGIEREKKPNATMRSRDVAAQALNLSAGWQHAPSGMLCRAQPHKVRS